MKFETETLKMVICRVSLIAGQDFPLHGSGTGTCDLNVGLDSLLECGAGFTTWNVGLVNGTGMWELAKLLSIKCSIAYGACLTK